MSTHLIELRGRLNVKRAIRIITKATEHDSGKYRVELFGQTNRSLWHDHHFWHWCQPRVCDLNHWPEGEKHIIEFERTTGATRAGVRPAYRSLEDRNPGVQLWAERG